MKKALKDRSPGSGGFDLVGVGGMVSVGACVGVGGIVHGGYEVGGMVSGGFGVGGIVRGTRAGSHLKSTSKG